MSQPPRRRFIAKRASVELMLFVAAGAIVNIAVSTALAFAVNPWQSRVESSDWGGATVAPNLDWVVERRSVAGATQIRSTWRTVDAQTFAKHTEWGFDQPGQSMFPYGLQSVAPPSPDRHQVYDMRGWPCLTLWTERNTQPWDGVVIPITPIWPGFAVNTAFYAAVLWGLFAAPFVLRRRLRIKRGLCPKCAYPVGTWGGEVCTECGAAVRAKAATA